MKKLVLLAVVLMMGLVLAACGGDDASSSEAAEADESVTLTATNFDFDQEEYHVNAGNVEIELVNEEGMHGITIDGVDGFEIENEGSQVVKLTPGEYTVRCSVPCGAGHSEMVATIHVE
ncbi:cytochrome C oxidase subunit II [Halalkalibacillus sediminis]|uniref:Cytochrome C oxidase subunit II n=1 Tax=Halalkalibacillus sediminis TaxID=2018042 RepID=A0A2I0QS04_9BACI|nr:cytochrome C oxidase subunit II [Halalkalibacillus sediminis]PKR77101.1 cytochrome C oxidase subunit II [Halalkalibacillus sediminis]